MTVSDRERVTHGSRREKAPPGFGAGQSTPPPEEGRVGILDRPAPPLPLPPDPQERGGEQRSIH